MHRNWIILLLTGLAATIARGDTFWSAAGAVANVTITGASDGKLLFQANGRDSTRDLSTITRIKLDDDPTFSGAEEAYTSSKFDLATDTYVMSLQTTTRSWLKPRIAYRLLDAAQRTNRFDAAATGYIAAVAMSANPASIAKPALPARGSSYLATAIKQVNAALADASLKPAARQALAAFLLDLQRASGDQQAVNATAEQMLQSSAAAGNTAAASSLVKVKFDAANAALQKADYKTALAQINNNQAIFIDPKDQAQALFMLAQIQRAQTSARSDSEPYKDVAIAYMRVVSHFPDSPQAPQALLQVAGIEQHQLTDPKTAQSLYQQLITQYPNDPAAATAKLELAKLSAK